MNAARQSSIPVFRQSPGVLLPSATYYSMQKGSRYIVDAIRPTLGPCPRKVAIERTLRNKSPELLDNGAIIARRIIDLPDPDENIGAMFVRGMLWRLYEQVGDGTATAAVLFQSVYDQGLKFIMAGGNAMRLRGYLEQGMHLVLDELSAATIPVDSREMLEQVAYGVCGDRLLAKTLAEVFDVIGQNGVLNILAGQGRDIRKEYAQGSYWSGGLHSRGMIDDRKLLRTQFDNAGIVISDMEINEPEELSPILRAALQARLNELVIVASKVSERVAGFLAGSQQSSRMRVFAVETPGLRLDDQMMAMEDLAVLTGGCKFIKAAGDSLNRIKPDDFGRARRVWADREYLGIIGGRGNPRQLCRHIRSLECAMQSAKTTEIRKRIRDRIGRLSGAIASLWIGGATETEIEYQKELALRTSEALRGAIEGGVVTGGGISLLACRPALKAKLEQAKCEEELAAYRILFNALDVPFQTIMINAGYEPGSIRAALNYDDSESVFDVVRGEAVKTRGASMGACSLDGPAVLDVSTVLKAAVRSAISSAALALTVDVFVHRRTLPVATRPD